LDDHFKLPNASPARILVLMSWKCSSHGCQ